MKSKPRILIVDDVSSNIHLLMNILKNDYTIIAATNGQKALELAKSAPHPDIILLDIVMPNMDGYEVCKQLKDSIITQEIPVVFVTSLNSVEEQEKGLIVGAVDFISKPFSKEIVLHKIATYLSFNQNPAYKKNELLSIQKEEVMSELKSKILVVDDSPENIQVIIESLKEEYIVSVATSAMKALRMLDEGLKPDLILLDVVMPEMDGYELCAILKERKEFKNIPVIFVTVLENEKDIVRGLKLGAVDYVVKPIEPMVLHARIDTHLKLKNYHDTLIQDIKIKDELIYSQSKLAVIGEMFENITHQWRQPLSAISVSTSGLSLEVEYGKLNEENLLKSLTTIDSSVKYLSQTIEDFKNFIASDTKEQKFDIKELVDKTLQLMESKFKNSLISIENDVKSMQISSYKNELIQILMNLISNAQDALLLKEGNRVLKIFSTLDKNILTLCIEDNANGIKSESIEKIFEKYFTTKGDKGSGLGLFMSRKIARERLGGDIKAHNITDGACFQIIISLA